jgi:D-glycero-alpha-D-manno-heptose-7-phosphate kinase
MVNRIDEVENDIARECMRLLAIDPPIYVHTVADIPACTGLGGSSSFAVGLLHALHAYRGERVSRGQLAEEATHIEIELLKQPIGKQDQYAAAFGGLNLFRFNRDGRVTVEPQRVSRSKLDQLFSRVMMFWTGLARPASSILGEQKTNTAAKFDSLLEMRGHAQRLQRLTSDGPIDFAKFGEILDQSWALKRQLAATITTNQIDDWYQRAREAGAAGGKICGAGGGGFLLLIVAPERRDSVRKALSGLMEIAIRPEVDGSRVLLPYMQ